MATLTQAKENLVVALRERSSERDGFSKELEIAKAALAAERDKVAVSEARMVALEVQSRTVTGDLTTMLGLLEEAKASGLRNLTEARAEAEGVLGSLRGQLQQEQATT